MRQLVPMFGVWKSTAHRIIDQLGPLLALQPRQRLRRTPCSSDGTLVPAHDHTLAGQSNYYRFSANPPGRHRRRHPSHRRDRPAPAG
ncbi:hypothetical protein ACIP4Y_33025 [Streptomyces sp. NPDC088810]|uniref:hypothetical protein n=1 Tax=Streptomyces sp. NPDC088810 TaxID=3365904 RepID=UPI00380E1277